MELKRFAESRAAIVAKIAALEAEKATLIEDKVRAYRESLLAVSDPIIKKLNEVITAFDTILACDVLTEDVCDRVIVDETAIKQSVDEEIAAFRKDMQAARPGMTTINTPTR